MSVAVHRTRKNKENPHYSFLYSWTPTEAGVKRESNLVKDVQAPRPSASKKADIQAKDNSTKRIKKDIIRSLSLVSFMLILELVVYLARNKFILP
jgi:hypothetical protein